ncbi:MAG: nucleoside-diphosphate sugar epimerase, partial [Xenophilus sp.]
FDANLVVAQAALAAGARRAGLVSALGASARSSVFYSRVKGELEEALAALPFEALVIARPSMLRGDRHALGQPARGGELLWARLDAVLRPVIPRRLHSIAAADVAAALVRSVPAARGCEVLDSAAMQGAASS